MTAYFLLVPLSLCLGSTGLFLVLDRIRRAHFADDACPSPRRAIAR
jgi:hypothetical protein